MPARLLVLAILAASLTGCPPSQPTHHARLVLAPPDAPQRHAAALP